MLLVDGSNYLFRGHFALPQLRSADGVATGATRGFLNMLMADIAFLRPTYMAVVFDRGGKNFRHELYPDYKGTRASKDDLTEVFEQVPRIREIVKSLGIRVVGKKGIEGDDIIGTLAHKHRPNVRVVIASSDKDFAQLVGPNVSMMDKERNLLGSAEIKEKFGVLPNQFVEYLMLMGDTSDNIPGVNKCGPKTAAKWLTEHKNLKTLDKVRPFTPALAKNYDEVRDFFPLSRKLCTIHCDIVRTKLENLRVQSPDWELAKELCEELSLRATYAGLRKVIRW